MPEKANTSTYYQVLEDKKFVREPLNNEMRAIICL
jgi:hypothetical protein